MTEDAVTTTAAATAITATIVVTTTAILVLPPTEEAVVIAMVDTEEIDAGTGLVSGTKVPTTTTGLLRHDEGFIRHITDHLDRDTDRDHPA